MVPQPAFLLLSVWQRLPFVIWLLETPGFLIQVHLEAQPIIKVLSDTLHNTSLHPLFI